MSLFTFLFRVEWSTREWERKGNANILVCIEDKLHWKSFRCLHLCWITARCVYVFGPCGEGVHRIKRWNEKRWPNGEAHTQCAHFIACFHVSIIHILIHIFVGLLNVFELAFSLDLSHSLDIAVRLDMSYYSYSAWCCSFAASHLLHLLHCFWWWWCAFRSAFSTHNTKLTQKHSKCEDK